MLVHAQSVVDVPRKLQVMLRGDAHLFSEPHTVTLELEPGVGTRDGRGLTQRRGRAYLTPEDVTTRNALSVVSLLTVGGLATFTLGGGVGLIEVTVDTEAPYVDQAEEVRVKELFRPQASLVARAARQ